jgi:dienelactone hydrolase
LPADFFDEVWTQPVQCQGKIEKPVGKPFLIKDRSEERDHEKIIYTDKNSYTMKRLLFPFVLASSIFCISCNDEAAKEPEPAAETKPAEPMIRSEAVSYKDDTVSCQGFVAYDANDSSKRPAILVVPEWWGVVDFTKSKAEELAKLGYVAMAVDMYGNGKVADNPKDAGSMAMPFYTNPQMAKKRLEAALDALKKLPQTDPSRIGAIGYCFGGSMVLNAAKLGENFAAVVSLHGGLEGVAPTKDMKTKFLVCHGGADSFVPQAQVDKFKKQMDSVGANYDFKVYAGATHAFTNPGADEKAKKFKMPIAYNPAADSASWKDMTDFLGKNLK